MRYYCINLGNISIPENHRIIESYNVFRKCSITICHVRSRSQAGNVKNVEQTLCLFDSDSQKAVKSNQQKVFVLVLAIPLCLLGAIFVILDIFE